MNTNLLKGKIIEKGLSMQEFSAKTGIKNGIFIGKQNRILFPCHQKYKAKYCFDAVGFDTNKCSVVIGQFIKYIIIKYERTVLYMKVLEGFTEIEPTEEIKAKVRDKRLLEGDNLLVQEMRFGEKGRIRLIGNRNPDPVKHQELMDEIALILYGGYVRSQQQQADKKSGD